MILHPASRSRRLGFPGLPHSDRLAGQLGRRLDDQHHWFRDLAPAGLAALEAVVVGPGGTWVLSSHGERGRFTRRNGHWYRWNRSTESWVPWDPAPVTAARLAARSLALYLERAGLPAAVEAVLVPPADMSVELPHGDDVGIIVEREAERLATLIVAEERLNPSQVDRIVALLDPRQPLPRLAPSTPGG